MSNNDQTIIVTRIAEGSRKWRMDKTLTTEHQKAWASSKFRLSRREFNALLRMSNVTKIGDEMINNNFFVLEGKYIYHAVSSLQIVDRKKQTIMVHWPIEIVSSEKPTEVPAAEPMDVSTAEPMEETPAPSPTEVPAAEESMPKTATVPFLARKLTEAAQIAKNLKDRVDFLENVVIEADKQLKEARSQNEILTNALEEERRKNATNI